MKTYTNTLNIKKRTSLLEAICFPALYWIVEIYLLCLFITPGANAQTTVYRSWGFETQQDQDSWYAENGTWEMGVPTFGPSPNKDGKRAYAGDNCAATVLGGNYTYGQSSRLIGPTFVVPAADKHPCLRFWHWYNFAGVAGGGRVQVKQGANDWVTISPEYAQDGGGVWTRPLIDLSAYAGKQVQLGFYFTAPPANFGGVAAGWYIDDVSVVTGQPIYNNFETWEGGLGDWYVDTGTWEVGAPSSAAHQGTNCAATVLSGNYVYGQASRLISPAFTVPDAASNPRLRFWHTYSFAGTTAGGRVQIKEGTNEWVTVSPEYAQDSGGVWTRPSIDLLTYAGKQVQLGFYFTAPPANFGGVGLGWYIDEITVVTGPLVLSNPENWDGGLGDWYADTGTWEVGVPSFAAHQGTNCAATVLSGNYVYGQASRLISPTFTVPDAVSNPRLRFWHTYSFAGTTAGGRVQIKEGTNEWVTISPEYAQNSGGVWTRPSIDLLTYAGKQVQLGFYFTAPPANFGGVGLGWYIDEITVVTGPLVLSNPENWDGGLGDWYADTGTWEVGVPSFAAHQGTNCAATVLSGNYVYGQASRLISPTFTVPDAVSNPRLRFWHTYSFAGTTAGGRVQIKEGTNEWVTISPEYAQNSGGVWTRPLIGLSTYAGKQVQLGFYFTAPPANFGGVDLGWYIDEVALLHDFVLQTLGSPVIRTQNVACISLGIAATSLPRNVSFNIIGDDRLVSSLTLATEACWTGSIAHPSASEWKVTLENNCDSVPMGLKTVGSICFTAASQQSVFVILEPNSPLVVNGDNSQPPVIRSLGTRAVLIADQPLVDAWLDRNGQRMATIYGLAGKTYEIQHTTDFVDTYLWTPGWTNNIDSSLFQSFPITGALSNTPSLYLRAIQR